MIKHLLTVAVISTAMAAAAQTVPNGGFEHWSPGIFVTPDDWLSSNLLLTYQGSDSSNVEKSTTVKHSGSSSVLCRTIDVDGTPTAGGVALGSFDLAASTIAFGVPFTERPDSLIGWFKYIAAGSDQFTVTITLSAWDGSDRIDIGTGDFTGDALANFTRKAIGISYADGTMPDTLSIQIASSGDNAEIGSKLWADDLSLVTNSHAGITELKQAKMQISPNPADKSLAITVAKNESIEVYNVLGSRMDVISVSQAESSNLNVSQYKNGVYFLKTGDGQITRFVIQH